MCSSEITEIFINEELQLYLITIMVQPPLLYKNLYVYFYQNDKLEILISLTLNS